jgi:phosphatidylinositol alpha 1,6-mannosyltransferase
MRIAVVSEGFHPEVSGVTIAVARHIIGFAARGHELLLLHPRYPAETLGLFHASPAPELPCPRVAFASDPLVPARPETRVPTRQGAEELASALTRFRPAAVFYHNPDRLVPDLARPWRPRRVAGLTAALQTGAVAVPIIHTLMPLYVERSGPWIWRTAPAAALARRIWCGVYNDNFAFAVTVDKAARDYVQSAGIKIPVLAGPWNGTDTAMFHPRERVRAAGAPLRIVWIGRAVLEKNTRLLAPLVHALRAGGLRFELVIVGDGPLLPELRAAFGQQGDVVLRGWRTPAQIAEELAAADLYLSLSDTESFSLTAEEALASGVPVIAPEVIGFKRLAGQGLGWLFPGAWLTPTGMRSLAAAIVREATAPQLAEWSTRARAQAAGRSWDGALASLAAALGERTGLAF